MTSDNCELIGETLRVRFGIQSDDPLKIQIVGSAKLGFSISEKHLADGSILPRYRAFSPVSDIDTVVICPMIFDAIWNDLSTYAGQSVSRLPWNSGALGDYLVHGWLRPDLFPKVTSLRKCQDWWNVFSELSLNKDFNRHSVRGAIFHSLEHLKRYQLRSITECVRVEVIGQ